MKVHIETCPIVFCSSCTFLLTSFLPAVYIRLVKVSRDIRKLRVFEETLLSAYQQYLTLLDDCIRGEQRGGEGSQYGLISLSLCVQLV